jgi:meiotically up-regulated gene 157 (Mug157) protein
MKKTSLSEHIDQMKKMAEMLVRHTYPNGFNKEGTANVTFDDEQEIVLLKQRKVKVDGYSVTVCLSYANYEKYTLKSLQVQANQGAFLPFNVVCKVGREFLGDENISYVDFFRNNKKVYCWTVKTLNGEPLPPGKTATPSSYEGFDYSILNPGSVDLY